MGKRECLAFVAEMWRMRYTLGELGGILVLCDGILRSVRKSGGNDMRKWKSCLLLAAGMAVALSTAVMAS